MKVKVEKIDSLGNGIGYINNKIIFIPKCVINDEIEVQIIKETKNYYIGKVINYLTSNNSVFCPYFYKCGGCQLQRMNYEESIKYKEKRIRDILCYDGKINVIENEFPKNYRNKIELKIKNRKIGFYENKTHELIEIDKCFISKDCINRFITEINNLNIVNADILIRCNFNDELLISINTKDNVILKNDYSKYKVVGIILNGKCVYGQDHFIDKISNLFFEVSYNSFFQVNSFINEKLFEIIKNNVKENKVLDLYSGVGTLSIMAAESAKEVFAIENVENAVINAIKNARMNNKDNIKFILGNVEDKIKFINDKVDTIILDPPRIGLKKGVLDKVLNLNPDKIIYISCEANQLKNDLSLLKDKYNIKELFILDMFSYTYHVESVVILKRKY